MTAPGYCSPCCGEPCHINLSGSGPGMSGYYVCEACGQPCDPMPREGRDRIVAEGMERAAKACDELEGLAVSNGRSDTAGVSKVCAISIRREAGRLAPKRRDIPTSPDTTPPPGGKK